MNEKKKQKQQERMMQQKRLIQRKNQICAEYPEIGSFIRVKEKWVNGLMLFGLVLYFLQAVLMGRAMELSFLASFLIVLGYWKYLLILMLCNGIGLKPLISAGGLCILFFVSSFYKILEPVGYSFGNLILLYQQMFQFSPLLTILDLLIWLFFFVICATIISLLFLPKNRRLAKQMDELFGTWKPSKNNMKFKQEDGGYGETE